MEQPGLCDRCGNVSVLYSCILCGKRVCRSCYAGDKKACVDCIKGRRISNDRGSIDAMK